MLGPVITAEAHKAFARACQQPDNTAELSGIVEALQFLMPMELVPRDKSCLYLLRFTACR